MSHANTPPLKCQFDFKRDTNLFVSGSLAVLSSCVALFMKCSEATQYCIARKFRGYKSFAVFVDLSRPVKILICKTIFMSLIIAIGSESVKIKSQKLN